MSCVVPRHRTPAGTIPAGNCRSSRYVELGREALAAQHVWRRLFTITPVPGRSAGLAPSKSSALLAPCCGRSVLPHGGAFGLEIDRSGALGRASIVVACPPADRHRIVHACCQGTAAVERGAPAHPGLALQARRSLDSFPALGPGRLGTRSSAAAGSVSSAPQNHRSRSRSPAGPSSYGPSSLRSGPLGPRPAATRRGTRGNQFLQSASIAS